MPGRSTAYHESLLHRVWKSLYMKVPQLHTAEGEPVTIIDPGIHNHSDGPDFLLAELRIGAIKLHGDIEIHWKRQDWNLHRHHEDPGFNRVILHVVYHAEEATVKPVLRQDQTAIHTLHLKPFLNEPLQSFLNRFDRPGTLPCSGHLSFISEEAFNRQFEKTRKLYFEQKVNDLLHFYDASLPPSRAWVHMLATGLFDGLGITHNREPMQRLCRQLLSPASVPSSCSGLTGQALAISGIDQSTFPPGFRWKHKSCRPANHPRLRIRQAAECLWFIRRHPFGQWLKNDPAQLWNQLNKQIKTHPGLGKERGGILYGTVWLPAFFILGNLFGSGRIASSAYESWLSHRVTLPSSLLNSLASLPVSANTYRHHLGTVHQLRSYCGPRKCEGCEVFKRVISA